VDDIVTFFESSQPLRDYHAKAKLMDSEDGHLERRQKTSCDYRF